MSHKISTMNEESSQYLNKNLTIKVFDHKHGGSEVFIFCNSMWHLQFSCTKTGFIEYVVHLVTNSLKEHSVAFNVALRDTTGNIFQRASGNGKLCKGKIRVLKGFIMIEHFRLIGYPDIMFNCSLSCENPILKTSSSQTVQKVEHIKEKDYNINLLTLSENLSDIFKTGRNTDLQISVGAEEFQAHSLILSARSPIFAAVMENHIVSEKKKRVIKIEDCEPGIFNKFLCFLYSAQLDKMPNKDYLSIYEVAQKYDVKDLKILCAQRIVDDLSEELVCDVLEIMQRSEVKDLKDSAMNHFIKNANNIMATRKWTSFVEKYSSIANEMVKRYVEKVSD